MSNMAYHRDAVLLSTGGTAFDDRQIGGAEPP
jgi:hypothetical protein